VGLGARVVVTMAVPAPILWPTVIIAAGVLIVGPATPDGTLARTLARWAGHSGGSCGAPRARSHAPAVRRLDWRADRRIVDSRGRSGGAPGCAW